MKSKFLLISLILSLVLLSSLNVMAFMPTSHLFIFDKATAEPINSDLYTACVKYPALCYSGNQLVDIGVYYYYTQGIKYATMHSPSFCKLLLENSAKIPNHDPEMQKACAVGGCTHLTADLPSHGPNGMVEFSIKNSYLTNGIIHVFGEQHADNIITSENTGIDYEKVDFLTSSQECQDLFITSMLGTDAFKDMDETSLRIVYTNFVQEIVSSTSTGYNPAFKEKSFLGDFDSIPFVITAFFIVIMAGLLLMIVLIFFKIIRRNAKIRHWIALLIFIPMLLIMAYLMYGALTGSAFNNFITIIKPISNLVPIGDLDGYTRSAIVGTKDLFQNGETVLEGTDPSGIGTNPVLLNASDSILFMDYIIIGVIFLAFLVFIWYLFKKNKVIQQGGFNL